MPLFFFISGLVLTKDRVDENWGATFKHYSHRLLLPYVIFSFGTYLPWLLFTRHLGADASLNIPIWKPIIGTFYGIGIDGWLQHNAMLWFFPCIFVTHLLFKLIHNIFKGAVTLGVIIVVAASGILLGNNLNFRLPWGVEIALIALPFYSCGYWASRKFIDFFPKRSKKTALVFIVIIVIQFYCIYLNGRVDMNFISLGNPLLFYLGAFAGIAALACIVLYIPLNYFFTIIAKSAFLTFPLHRVMFSFFSALGLFILDDLQAFKISIWDTLSYTIGAIGMSIFLLPLVRRFLPVLLGGR
jgi:acyltransferase